MNATDLFLLNCEEVRRRSMMVWKAIPENMLHWKPDKDALTCAETIRHLLQGEFLFHQVLVGRSGKALIGLHNPFEGREFQSVDEEIAFAQPYREQFLAYIKSIDINDLNSVQIDLKDEGGYIRPLGDMLLRIPYHEAIHTGQLLNYMRTMGVARPQIWD
ncbi:DinB family protein [Paenibacillus chungangensis]|uniref:DinB family protein n=1 Tax=Paenibacillus chungangensis TaxID=696535 RepID=A0ABW3HRD7_9BACL